MGKRGHLPPSGNVVKCFCALVVTAKRSVDELFKHYFHKLSLASGGFAPRGPHQNSIPGLCWGKFRHQSETSNLPTPVKNPAAGAYAHSTDEMGAVLVL